MAYTGRRIIYTSENVIDANNILDVLGKAMNIHNVNSAETDYLYRYYKGEQPILRREKEVRPEICNKIVENRANEIVSFKVGYLCGEPIQYVSRSGDDGIVEQINTLNEMMFAEDKAAQDEELVEWDMICGTAYRMVLPNELAGVEDESPFELYTLDPRNTFVVYSDDIGHKPMMGVTFYRDNSMVTHFSVYTEHHYFLIENDIITEERDTALSDIPIFEYPANNARLGAFEIVLPLLDTINNIESNRMDGIEQQIQSFLKFINCDIDSEDIAKLKDLGAIKIKSVDGNNADVDVVKNDFSQTESQTFKTDMYDAILTICGMPNRNGGSSTSDTGAAVLLRDGWSLAEARAKDSEHMFKRAEKKMLKLVLNICRQFGFTNLHLADIDCKFTRRNYENIQSKAQVLTTMLQNPKIHPQLAFQHSGMFSDAESAYAMSKKYYEDEMKKWNPEVVDESEEDNADGEQQ